MHVYVCGDGDQRETQVSCSVSLCSIPLSQSHIVNLELAIAQLDWLATELWGTNCLCPAFPCWGYSCTLPSLAFIWVLGLQTHIYLCSRCSYLLSHLRNPLNIFLLDYFILEPHLSPYHFSLSFFYSFVG